MFRLYHSGVFYSVYTYLPAVSIYPNFVHMPVSHTRASAGIEWLLFVPYEQGDAVCLETGNSQQTTARTCMAKSVGVVVGKLDKKYTHPILATLTCLSRFSQCIVRGGEGDQTVREILRKAGQKTR
jgi:hypothetical protein